MARRASSILKSLSPKPWASREQLVGCGFEVFARGAFSLQKRLDLPVSPGFVSHTAQGETSYCDSLAFDFKSHRERYERECIRSAIAHFQVRVVLSESSRWQLNGCDDLPGLEIRIQMRFIARQTMKIFEAYLPLAPFIGDTYLGFQSRQRDAHVRGMDGDAVFAGAQNGMHAIVTVNRRATAAGFAFVAGSGQVVEIRTPGALQQISAIGGHVADLW
jgi:hypothetical protein